MVVTQRPMARARGLSTVVTWVASSLVGMRTRPRGRAGSVDPPASRLTRGREKPRVLPEPVWARPRMSRPASASGSAAAWTGNGSVIPWSSRTSTSGAGTPRSAKVASAVRSGAGTAELSAGMAVNGKSSPGLGGSLTRRLISPLTRGKAATTPMLTDVLGFQFGAPSDLRSRKSTSPANRLHTMIMQTASHPEGRDAHQGVVGDERDRQVHDEQEPDRLAGLPAGQDVDVGQPEHQRDEDGHAEEHPPRLRGDTRGDRPGDAGDDHADHRQLGVIGELEVRVPLGAGKDGLGDDDEDRVGKQRTDDRRHGRDHHPRAGGLAVLRREIEVDEVENL